MTMKNLGLILSVTMVCLGMARNAQAVCPVVPPKIDPGKPYISLSFKPDKLELGTIPYKGELPATLDAHIVANCPHQIKASYEPFEQRKSKVTIKPEHTSVVINGKDVPEVGRSVTIIKSAKPTPSTGINVPVDVKFSVANTMMYPAGSYKGALVFTITTVPQ